MASDSASKDEESKIEQSLGNSYSLAKEKRDLRDLFDSTFMSDYSTQSIIHDDVFEKIAQFAKKQKASSHSSKEDIKFYSPGQSNLINFEAGPSAGKATTAFDITLRPLNDLNSKGDLDPELVKKLGVSNRKPPEKSRSKSKRKVLRNSKKRSRSRSFDRSHSRDSSGEELSKIVDGKTKVTTLRTTDPLDSPRGSLDNTGTKQSEAAASESKKKESCKKEEEDHEEKNRQKQI